MKDLQDKIAHVVVELNSRHFLHWMESLKNGKCVLDRPWIFCSKKGTNPRINFGRIWHDIKSYMEVPIICIHPFKWVATTGQQFLIAQQISFMTFDNMYSLGFFFKLWFNNDLLTVHWRASCLGLSDAWVQSSSSWRTSFWKQCSKHKYTCRKWSHRILPATNKNKINTLIGYN